MNLNVIFSGTEINGHGLVCLVRKHKPHLGRQVDRQRERDREWERETERERHTHTEGKSDHAYPKEIFCRFYGEKKNFLRQAL